MPLDGVHTEGSSSAGIDDAEYYRTRSLQEQVAAQKATSEAARESHDQLAAMYRFRAMMVSTPRLSKAVGRPQTELEPS